MHLLHVVYLLMDIWFISSFWLLHFFRSLVHFFRSPCVCQFVQGIDLGMELLVRGCAYPQLDQIKARLFFSQCHCLHPTRECPLLRVFASLWESDFEIVTGVIGGEQYLR